MGTLASGGHLDEDHTSEVVELFKQGHDLVEGWLMDLNKYIGNTPVEWGTVGIF